MPRRPLAFALLTLGVFAAGGCSRWNLDHLRDPRAVEVERRLDKDLSKADRAAARSEEDRE